MSEDFIQVCNADPCGLTPYPLIFTLVFPSFELWCLRCGAKYKITYAEKLPAGIVNAHAEGVEQRAARYLFAVACETKDRVRLSGRWHKTAFLPHAMRRENAEIIKNWRYEICATQS